jgi:outer membrane protein assembly factor BamE (lipoprotein component of BamABCDE complex)
MSSLSSLQRRSFASDGLFSLESKRLVRLMLAGVIALFALALLAGCDQKKIEKLEEGLSTENDVRAQFGQPYAVVQQPDGSKTLEYPRQPEGQTNYMITIDAGGKMSSLRQLLNTDNLARVVPGLTRDEVRRMLGKPAKMQRFELKRQEVWDWRYQDRDAKMFSVTFDDNGRVLGTASIPDPKYDKP